MRACLLTICGVISLILCLFEERPCYADDRKSRPFNCEYVDYNGWKIIDLQLMNISSNQKKTIFSEMPLKVGDIFSTETLCQSLSFIYNKKVYEEIKLEFIEEDQGIKIQIIPIPYLVFSDISIKGNKFIGVERLRRSTRVMKGRRISSTTLDSMKDSLEEVYLSEGFLDVKIDVNIYKRDFISKADSRV